MHPSIRIVIFDCIFNQIGQGKGEFDFIYFRHYRAETFHNKFHVLFLCDRTQTFHDPLQQFIDLNACNIDISGRFIHFYQRKQIIDDFILTVNLCTNICHKFPIKFYRNILLSHQGVCKDFHGSQWCLQFVGHVRYKLLATLIQCLQTSQHLVTGCRHRLRFRI